MFGGWKAPSRVRSDGDTEETLSRLLTDNKGATNVAIAAYRSTALPQALLHSKTVECLHLINPLAPLEVADVPSDAWGALRSLHLNYCKTVPLWECLASLPALESIVADHMTNALLPKGEWPSLKSLSITYSSLAAPIPKHILDLPHLESLDLTNTKVASLGSRVIPDLKEGQLLGLRALTLMGPSVASVPEGLQRLPHLEVLSLAGCPIPAFPATAEGEFPALKRLKLHFCSKLHCLPPSIQRLPLLETLVLSHSGIVALPEVEEDGFKALTELDLEGCSSLLAIPEYYYGLPALKSLQASSCPFVL